MTRIAILASAPILAATLLFALSLARRSEPPPPPPPEPEIVCVMLEQPTDPKLPPMPPQEPYVPKPVVDVKPMPEASIYTHLEACLKDLERMWGQKMAPITVAQVRYWVEVEKDPVWLEGGSWWLPLSGEGTPDFPSGIYISVPLQGGTCGGAIVN